MPNYPEELITTYYKRKCKSRLSNSDIRNELSGEGYDKKTVTQIMNKLDNMSVDKELQQNVKRRYISITSSGILLFSVGFFLFTCSVFKLLNSQLEFYYTLIPLIMGVLLFLRGRIMYKHYKEDYKL